MHRRALVALLPVDASRKHTGTAMLNERIEMLRLTSRRHAREGGARVRKKECEPKAKVWVFPRKAATVSTRG
jgi:putative protein kinase ArgK-like GTPase of G3E family